MSSYDKFGGIDRIPMPCVNKSKEQIELESSIRDCAPEDLNLWINAQINGCTAERKLQILQALSEQEKADAFAIVLNSITSSDISYFSSKCHFAGWIDQAVRKNNAPLLQQWLDLLKQIPNKNQADVWLSTSETLAYILKTGSSPQAHAEYFKGLEQAKYKVFAKALPEANVFGITSEDIKEILEAKDQDGVPGLHIALQKGHAETVQAFLEALLWLKEAFNLTVEQIKEIVEARSSHGVLGLAVARHFGHNDAADVYEAALPVLGYSTDEIEHLRKRAKSQYSIQRRHIDRDR